MGEEKGYAVFNPENRPLSELPVIYGFNNGGSRGWLGATAVAEDGTILGSHICSDEWFIPHDLGVIEGTRLDRHENEYSKHYPSGYRMDFVPSSEIVGHAALNRAFDLCREKQRAEEEQ